VTFVQCDNMAGGRGCDRHPFVGWWPRV